MADPRIAMRALQQIRGGGANPVALARRAILSRSSLPQDYYDPEQEALDSMDEMDPEAYATPGDPYPGRPFDPGDESRAAAIDAYNRGPKPGADPRGFMRDDERGEAMMGIDDDESTEYGTPMDESVRPSFGSGVRPSGPSGNPRGYGPAYNAAQQRAADVYRPAGHSSMMPQDMRSEYDAPVYEDVSIGMPSSIRSAGVSGNPRGYGPAYNAAQQRAAEFIPRTPRNAAEAVNALGPVFAQLGQGSAYTGTPRATTAPMGERYAAAGSAPSVGGTPEELDAEKRRILAGL